LRFARADGVARRRVEWGLLRDTLAVSSANRLRFKGMIWEGDSTQLYYARNRWYSPQFGGFMSEDPLGPAGGANTYAFADNDPVNGSDPLGLSAFTGGGMDWSFPTLARYIGMARSGKPLDLTRWHHGRKRGTYLVH